MLRFTHIILLVAAFLVSQNAAAKDYVLSGIITDSYGQPLDVVNVIVSRPDSKFKILASAITDNAGHYRVSFKTETDSIMLRASGMSIKPFSVILPANTTSHDIVAETSEIKLKEVVVKSKKIYAEGDTINYNVANFLSQSDQSIADVLKKMPGISVSSSGQVSYQGKPIKNFYIEGLDLMKGHYGIAANNIDPNNISTVQVLENHQDIKALKGLKPEEQASINIKLKEGVKGVFNLITTVGGGYGGKGLWNNAAIATYFKRNSQFLATYKGNNTGEDLSQELYSFDNDYSRTNNISSITMPSAPGIDKRFYYFNRSHNATFNNVWRIRKSGELGINAAYLNDRDTRQNHSATTNILPDGSKNFVNETMNGTARHQKAYGDVTFISNNDENYLKEQIKLDWSRNRSFSRISANGTPIDQFGNSDTYRLLNKFHITRRSGEYRGFEIISLANLEKRPHSLSVSPNLFPDFIAGEMLSQHVDYRDLSTENSFSLLSAFTLGNFTLRPAAIVNYHRNTLSSHLSIHLNDIALDYLDAGLGPEFVYGSRKVHISLFVPMKYKYFRLDNRIGNNLTHKNRFRIEPNLNLTCKLNSSHSIKLQSLLSYMTPSIENLYSGYILTSYRQLSAYDVSGLYEGSNLFTSLGYDFKNILSMSFAGIDLSWSRQSPEILYGSYFDGISQRTLSRPTSQTSDYLSAKLHGSQGFDWKRLKIGASASYSHYSSPLLVQNELMHYNGEVLSVDADLNLSPFKWLSVAYNGIYSQSSSRQKGLTRMPWLRTVTNEISLDFTIPGGITLTTSLYHYYNNFNQGDKSFLLLNADAKYSIKRFSFTLTCDNLLNRKNYLYSSLSALTESKSIYSIRPRSILLKIRFRIL